MIKRVFHPQVVLVRSLYDSNIGASSRAMANMGVSDLILIGPQCEITYAAQQAAATGQTALQTRRTYANWDEFFQREPDGLRIAFSARDGSTRLVQDFATTLGSIEKNDARWSKEGPAIPLYLIFGPEDWGLSAEDLELVHHTVSIPTFGDNPSLNLGQAVLLGLFILRTQWGGEKFVYEERGQDTVFQEREDLFPEQSLKQFLLAMGFSLGNPRMNVYTVFRRLLLRTVPSTKERRILEIIFQQGARKMRDRE